jgi:exopolysaccharide production protein ExoQ
VVAQLEPTDHRVLQYDPQGHRMGPIGTLAAQGALVWGLIWNMGVIQDLLIPPAAGMLALMLALGAAMLAPRRVIMEFPISFSLLGILTISVASVMWTVAADATQANLRAIIPAVLGMIIATGLLTLRDTMNAFIWAIRIALLITVIALVLFPATRLHVGVESGGVEDYAGWHGFFTHKNRLSGFMVVAIPTLLVFHRNGIVKWLTLGTIGVILVGSTSATGLSAAFFVVVAWVWLVIYHTQSREDARNATLLFLTSVLGFLAVVTAAFASIQTVTSAYGKDTTFSGRTLIWEASIDAIGRRPWLGHGFGALFYRERVSSATAEIWRQVGFENSHAHNGLLELLLQVGFVGGAIFGVLWASIAWRGWEAIAKQPDLGIWVTCVVSANLLMSLSEDVFTLGWIAIFGMMKMLLMRRDESLRRPGWLGHQIDKWALR